jgi:hypothetical protein
VRVEDDGALELESFLAVQGDALKKPCLDHAGDETRPGLQRGVHVLGFTPDHTLLVFRYAHTLCSQKPTGHLLDTVTVLSLYQHKWRLHAALRSRHAEESSMAVGPLTVQSICTRPRTSLATYLSQCTDTYFTDFSLFEAAKQGITYTTVASNSIRRPDTQTHAKRLLQTKQQGSSCQFSQLLHLCITA